MASGWSRCALAGALLLLGGCAPHSLPAPAPAQPAVPQPPAPAASAPAPPRPPALPHYRCDQGLAFDVRFGDGDAQLLFASRESETLLRDAGGVTPQQTVYSSTKLKAEFGLDPDGRGARLNFTDPPREAQCRRE